jgi:anaerobic magnesium-protoporphyrin IX monomethyl ester cyclase
MLTKLLFPPQWIPTQPYLSLPSLTAYLKSNNCNVEQMDINVSFFDEILSKKGLRLFYEKACTKFQEIESKKELTSEFHKQYYILGSSTLYGEYTIEKVEEAKQILRSRNKFYEFDELNNAFRILELGLMLASSAYYPTNLTFHTYDMRYSCRSSKAVLEAIDDRKENLFIEYFEKNTLHKVLENKPDLIGISIINTSQLIPGLTLAHLIKKASPDIHINIGGSVFTRLIDELRNNSELFSVFDSVIVHEGETALLDLIKHLNGEYDIEDIPNLIYKQGSQIRVNRISSFGEDVNSLPTPTFDGFPLKLYLSPELVIPVLSSRGCYWNRCSFCDHGYGYSGKYRPRNVDLLYDDLKTLKSKYKTDFFTFQDEGISPNLMSALSDRILENGLEISWLADSRFEASLSAELSNKIAEAGCKMLYFGLESANDRILKCMDKGIKKENVLNICEYANDAGIWTHLFLIFGFPTETLDEAKETMDFIMQNKRIINSMSFGSFQLTKHSKVYENPASFGVKQIFQNDSADLSLWYEYEVEKGMSKRETDELIREFYNMLSLQYRDFRIWRDFDREHLFLYITHYKRTKEEVPKLYELIDRIQVELSKNKSLIGDIEGDSAYPMLNDGVFIGTFNFNLAQINQAMMAGYVLGSLQQERTYVLFNINTGRFFTITDFMKDILDMSNGKFRLSGIIDMIKEKYQIPESEAEFKCKNLVNGLIEKNIVKT